jgi:hypothetical protein
VNSVLKKSNEFLGQDKRPFPDFEQFDEAAMPTISDVLIIISQYLSGFEKLRTENIAGDDSYHTDWYWKGTLIRTAPPKNLSN